MAGLRKRALSVPPGEVGITPVADEPFAVVMDIGFPQAVVTLAAFSSGEASLYFSNGGGIVGGSTHEPVRKAAIAFVHDAARFTGQMQPAADYPSASAGNVIFYVRTSGKVLKAEAPEAELASGKHALAPLYLAAQNVITQLRLTSKPRK